MLEMICNIPENIGWAMVGGLMVITWIMGWKVGKLIYQAIKERLEENEFWKVHHCDEGEE